MGNEVVCQDRALAGAPGLSPTAGHGPHHLGSRYETVQPRLINPSLCGCVGCDMLLNLSEPWFLISQAGGGMGAKTILTYLAELS